MSLHNLKTFKKAQVNQMCILFKSQPFDEVFYHHMICVFAPNYPQLIIKVILKLQS